MIGRPYPRRSVLCALATSRHSLRYCLNKVFLDQSLASAYHYMVADWIAKDPETLIGRPYPRGSVLCALATSQHSLRYVLIKCS